MTRPTDELHLLSPLDERYIANPIVYRALTATVAIVLEGGPLRRPDGRLDRDRIVARVAERIHDVRELNQRLLTAPLGLTAPAWCATSLDLDYHVRFHPEVLGDDDDAIQVLNGRAAGDLDPRRPLWRFTFAELADGDVAWIVTWHHVMGDAMFGLRTMLALLDDPDPEDVAAVASPGWSRTPIARTSLPATVNRAWRARHPTAAERRADLLRTPRRRLRRWAARVSRPLRNRVISLGGAERRLPRRVYRMVHLTSSEVEEIASGLGLSLNDLTVAAAFRSVFESRPDLTEAALLVPIASRRVEDRSARNAIRTVRVSVRRDAELASLGDEVRRQIRRGAIAGGSDDGPRLGYATHVPTRDTEKHFCGAAIRVVTGWPVGDPREPLALLATSYRDSFAVTFSATDELDADVLIASLTRTLGAAR